MARLTIIIGSLLTLLGVGMYAGLAVAEAKAVSVTALIPAMAGIPILLFGFVALREPWRKHAMHVVSILALLGLILPLGRLGMQMSRGLEVKPTVLTSLVFMAALSGFLLVACIRSFVRARLLRSAAE